MGTQVDYELLLWNAIRSGDDKAFESLYNLFFKSLYNYGRKISHDAALVEDSINDLFVDLWRKRNNLSEVNSIRFYLFKSLRRRLVKNLDQSLQFLDIESFSRESARFPSAPSCEAYIVEEEECSARVKKIKQMLHNLPPRQYEALMLRYYEGFSFDEIAVIMKVNSQTARNLAQRGIHHLRHYSKIIISSLFFLLIF